MKYNSFQDDRLSALGFGLMRLPMKDGAIDARQTAEMIDLAIRSGVNYFDNAWPYHDGLSETVCGEILSHYPRSSYRLADKFPGHQHLDNFTPAPIFEKQLEKCRVEYFDYYLLHNVCENSQDTYLNDQWGLLDYFLEQKRLGRIRHLGFSAHGEPECLRRFLDSQWGEHMEFCQIQLNYIDWTLQKADEKVALLNERHIPIWVMEGLRGGMLAEKGVEKAFRWIQQVPGVVVTLSGMSNLDQMKENIDIFSRLAPLDDDEQKELCSYTESLGNFIPCTSCRYCQSECPQGLSIPSLLSVLNDIRVGGASLTPMMFIEALPAHQQPSACLSCGNCSYICPQHIDIPAAMAELAGEYEKGTKWSEICRKRNEIARQLSKQNNQ